MSSKAIRSAFCHCGIWPFNPQIFTGANFAPSMMTSMCSFAPPSYPTKVSSSSSATLTESNMDDLTFHGSSDLGDNGAEVGSDAGEDDGHKDGDEDGNLPTVSKIVFSLGTHPKLPQHTALPEDPPSIPGSDDTMEL